jgi:hypothetical protein
MRERRYGGLTVLELLRLLPPSSPAPWLTDDHVLWAYPYPSVVTHRGDKDILLTTIIGRTGMLGKAQIEWANARLVAAAVNALPDLLRRVSELDKEPS